MSAPTGSLSWGRLLAFSAPTFAFAGQQIALGSFLPFFLNEAGGLSLATLALVTFWYRAWDTACGPVMGVVSDRWALPGHKRYSPMLLGTPLAVFSLMAIFFFARSLTMPGLLCALVLTSVGWSLINVSHGAWALELSVTPTQGARIFAARTLVGTMALPLFLVGPTMLEQIYGSDTALAGKVICLAIVVTQPLSLVLIRNLRSVAISPVRSEQSQHSGLITLLRFVVRERGALLLMGQFACYGAATITRADLLMFWMRDSLGQSRWSWTVILVQSVSGVAALPLWLSWRQQLGTERTMTLSLWATLAVALGVVLVPSRSLTGLICFAVVNGAVTGIGFILLRTLLGALLARQHQAGLGSSAGTLYSGFHFVHNLAAALALSGALALLGALHDPARLAIVTLDPGPGAITRWTLMLTTALPMIMALWLWRRPGNAFK